MSNAALAGDEAPSAPKAGADLREARERLGWSLPDVATSLRIRLTYLEALEDGQLSRLPGNAYALAFLRTYARSLGLDAEEIARRFKSEAAEMGRRTELVFPVPMPERGLPTGAIMLLGLLLIVAAYAGWYRLSGEGRLPPEAVTPVPERLASLAEQAPPPQPPISPIYASAAPVPVDPPRASVVAPAASEGRIMIRATADAWIMVKDHSGAVLLNRVLKSGDTWPVPPRTDLVLTTGNAGGTEIVIDGTALPALGALGGVRRDIPLDADGLKGVKPATTAATASNGLHGRQ